MRATDQASIPARRGCRTRRGERSAPRCGCRTAALSGREVVTVRAGGRRRLEHRIRDRSCGGQPVAVPETAHRQRHGRTVRAGVVVTRHRGAVGQHAGGYDQRLRPAAPDRAPLRSSGGSARGSTTSCPRSCRWPDADVRAVVSGSAMTISPVRPGRPGPTAMSVQLTPSSDTWTRVASAGSPRLLSPTSSTISENVCRRRGRRSGSCPRVWPSPLLHRVAAVTVQHVRQRVVLGRRSPPSAVTVQPARSTSVAGPGALQLGPVRQRVRQPPVAELDLGSAPRPPRVRRWPSADRSACRPGRDRSRDRPSRGRRRAPAVRGPASGRSPRPRRPGWRSTCRSPTLDVERPGLVARALWATTHQGAVPVAVRAFVPRPPPTRGGGCCEEPIRTAPGATNRLAWPSAQYSRLLGHRAVVVHRDHAAAGRAAADERTVVLVQGQVPQITD